MLSHHICKFVSILTWRGHFHRAGPVIVEVAHFVGEFLHVIGLKLRSIFQNNIVRRCYSALSHILRNQKEIVPKRSS